MEMMNSAAAGKPVIGRGAMLSCEMWQMPQLLWTRWCNVMIDAWADLLPASMALDAYPVQDIMPSTASPTERED